MRHFTLIFLLFLLSLPTAGQDNIASDDYFIEVSVSNPTPYVGEQIIYIIRYYAFYLPETIPYQVPDFDGFWLARQIDAADFQVETRNNRQYFVGQSVAEITPLNSGRVTIPPTRLFIADSVFRNGVDLLSEPVTVDVQPLPQPIPDDFTGAIGQYDLSTQLTPLETNIGEPLTFSMTIEGSGNFELLPAPRLDGLTGWRVYANPARFGSSLLGGGFGQKIFSWTVLPDITGTQVFPGVAFTYFDPRAREYMTIPPQPVSVDIFPVDGVEVRSQVDSRIQQAEPIALRAIDLSMTEHDLSNLVWLLWGLPPIGFAVFSVWRISKDRRKRHQREQRQTFALRNALRRLDQHVSADGRHLERVMLVYVADKLGTSTNDISRQGLERILAEHVSHSALTAFQNTRAQTEGIRYIPDKQLADDQVKRLRDDVIEALKYMERTWGKQGI